MRSAIVSKSPCPNGRSSRFFDKKIKNVSPWVSFTVTRSSRRVSTPLISRIKFVKIARTCS